MNKRLSKIGVMFIMLAVVVMIFTATVSANAVTEITINKTSPTTNDVVFGTNSTVSFSATVLPTNATDKTVTWVSSNTSVLKLRSGSTNPHTTALFDVVNPGSTTIIALSKAGTDTVVQTYQVNVVDKSITGGKSVKTINLFQTDALYTPISRLEVLPDFEITNVSQNKFSVTVTAYYSDGTQLQYNEIQQLITFHSNNSSKIWFDGWSADTNYGHNAVANFEVSEDITVQTAKTQLYTYVYDGYNLESSRTGFYRTAAPPLTLSQKAVVSSDGLSVTYNFTQVPVIIDSTNALVKQAPDFDHTDFTLKSKGGTVVTNPAVKDVTWNSASKSLTFTFDSKIPYSASTEYEVVPSDVNDNYGFLVGTQYYPISHVSSSNHRFFQGPVDVALPTDITIIPTTLSTNYSTDNNRIMYATKGVAGTFTITADTDPSSAAQFNITTIGTLPSGVVFKNVGDGKTATITVASSLAAGTYYIDIRAQYIGDTSVMLDKRLELRVGAQGTFSVSNITLTKSTSTIPVIQTSSPVPAVNADTLAATYKFYGATSVDKIVQTIISLDGTNTPYKTEIVPSDIQKSQLSSSAGLVLSYKIGTLSSGILDKLELGTYIMRVELFDGDTSLGITEVRFAVDTSFEMLDIYRNLSTERGIGTYAPNGTHLGNFQYDKTTGKYINMNSAEPDAVQRRSSNEYQLGASTALGDTLYFYVAVDGYSVGERIKFYVDDFVFGANKGGSLTAQTVTVEEYPGGPNFVSIPFTISDTTYLGTHVVQIKMAKTLDGTETFDHEINLKYDLESEYLTTEVEIYDELKNATGQREIKLNSDLHITRTLFIPEDRILTLECGNTLTIDPLRHVTVYGEIRMNENALSAEGSLVVTGKVALCSNENTGTHVDHAYYYYASPIASDNPYLLITDGSNITMNGSFVDGYTNMLTGSAVMDTVIETSIAGTDKDMSILDSNDSFILAQNGSQVTLAAGNTLELEEGAKLTVGKDSQFINEGILTTNRASVTSNGDLITRRTASAATNPAELYFSDVSATVPYISSNLSTGQFFLASSVADGIAVEAGGRVAPFDLVNGAVAISGTDYSNFDYKVFGNVQMYQDLNIRTGQELLIEQNSLLWIRTSATPPGYTLKLDGELHNKGALWVDGRAYGDGKYIEYVDSELAGDGSIELNGAENVLGAITGDVKLQKNGSGGYIITIPENGNANIVANFKMNSNDDLIISAGATLTVNSGVTFEVDGRVAIEPSKIDGGISYSSGTLTNNGTMTFGFGNNFADTATENYFSNLGTMNGTFGVKTSTALNSLVIPETVASWHPVNTGNNGISSNCAIVLMSSNSTFSTEGNWDLSYRVSENVYASKNITFTGAGSGNTTIEVTTNQPTINATSATTAADISKQTAKASNISFNGISFVSIANASHAVYVGNGVSSTNLSFEDCTFNGFDNAAFEFEKTASGTDNVSQFEVLNCVFNNEGIWANKLTNSTISGNTFSNILDNKYGIHLHFQGLKNSSGSDLYISDIELKDNNFTAVTATPKVGTGIHLGGADGAYIGEIEISGSTFAELITGVNIETPIVTTKTNDQITLKDLLITTSTFTDCTTAINATNLDEKVSSGANAPNALTPNNLLGTITYIKCTTKVNDPNNVFTFLVTSEQTLNDALSMSISNISMANSFSISGSVNISNKNLTVPSGMTLTVNSSATLRTSGTAQVNVIGTVANNGVLNVGGTSFGGTGRVNTLTTGRVDGTNPITMTTETVGGTSVRGTIDGIFFGDVTVQKNTSTGTFIIGVATDGYATANANYTLPVGSKLVGGVTSAGGDVSEFFISGSSTITVLGEVEEQYGHNSLHGNGTLSFAPGSKLTRTGTMNTDTTATLNTISSSQVIGDGGYLEFDRNITTTRLNRKGDNDAGYSYVLASGKMTINSDTATVPVPYLVDADNSLQVSTGANITVPSGHTFVVENEGRVMANQTGYGTIIGIDITSNAVLHEGSGFGSISGPVDDSVVATENTATYIWAVDKWASDTNIAGKDTDLAGANTIGGAFNGGAETIYFTPDMTAAATIRTTTGNLSVPAGRNLVIAENGELIVGAGHTLFINGSVTLETGATIIGAGASSKMEVATGKSIILNGVTYGSGEYIWDTTDNVWVNNVYNQETLTAALKNTVIKISRATQSFDVTAATTVPNGYELRVDDTMSLKIKENITFTVAAGGKVTDTDDVNALTGAMYTSRLVVQTGAEMKLTATTTLAEGINYAWNTIATTPTWTAYAGTATELKTHQNAGREVIVITNFSVSNGTRITKNLYIPDGLTLTVPSSSTLSINEKDGTAPSEDLIKTTANLNAGKIVGASTSSKLAVIDDTAINNSVGVGYGKPVGEYIWVGSGAAADWMKLVISWSDVLAAGAGEKIYYNPSSSTTSVTSDTEIKADVLIANSKTITVNAGVRLTVSGNITLGTSAAIKGFDSSSELDLQGTYTGLATGQDYAWYSNAWRSLITTAELGTAVTSGEVIVVTGGDMADSLAATPSIVSVAGTLIVQNGTTLKIGAHTTLDVSGTLVNGNVTSSDNTSRLRLTKTYTKQSGSMAIGWYIGGDIDGNGDTWTVTRSTISTSFTGNAVLERSSTYTIEAFTIGTSKLDSNGNRIGINDAILYVAPSPGTELVVGGTLTVLSTQASADAALDYHIRIGDPTNSGWISDTDAHLTGAGSRIKGLDADSKILIRLYSASGAHLGDTTYRWDIATGDWTL